MFNADPKTIQRLAHQLTRVMIVDSTPGSVKILADLLKDMGAREFAVCTDSARAFQALQDFEAQLIFTELSGPGVDGLAFTQRLRRSTLGARKVPVIMVTAEATQNSIIGARNAGVHEFLRKPYTAGDLFRRIETVILKPRPWIEAAMYVGPDRRRFNSGEFGGAKRRRSDAFEPSQTARAS